MNKINQVLVKNNFSQEDIREFRKNTPGVSSKIHFNNAGSSLMDAQVYNLIEAYLRDELYIGGYEAAEKWSNEMDDVYVQIASLINALPEEIAIVESATTAWYKAFHSMKLLPGDRVLFCESEYGSNVIGLMQAKGRLGIEIEIIPSGPEGTIDLGRLEQMIDQRVKLIAITHMPTNGGLVNPAERVGEIANRYDIPYLLDACQSVGHYPIDVQKIQCTFLAATGRKYMRGPRGTGFLFVKKSKINDLYSVFPDMVGGEWTKVFEYQPRIDARKYENFEGFRAGKLGLGLAAKQINLRGIHAIWDRNQWLGKRLREELSRNSKITLTDQGAIKSGLVTFKIHGMKAKDIMNFLRSHNINSSVTAAWATRIDMEKRNLDELVRTSLHYFNTVDEISAFGKVIHQMLK